MKKTDAILAIRNLLGEPMSVRSSLSRLQRLDTSHDVIQTATTLRQNLLPLKILWFLGLNPSSTRYRIARDLKTPHSSTVKVVAEMSRNGLIRVVDSYRAGTGLTALSYGITSFGMIPLISLYSATFPASKGTIRELAEEVRENFQELTSTASHLPLVGIFLQKWIFLETEDVAVEVAARLSRLFRIHLPDIIEIASGMAFGKYAELTAFKDTDRQQPRSVKAEEILNADNLDNQDSETLSEAVQYIEKEFKFLITRDIVDSHFHEYYRFSPRRPGGRLLRVFLSDPDLKQLLLHYVLEYKLRLGSDVRKLEDLERDLRRH